MQFTLDGQPLNANSLERPILISGKCHSGASFFSVALIADLINSGEKVLYFCQAKPGVELLRQFVRDEYIPQTIIAEPGNIKDFKNKLISCADISERVVFIKNIEDTVDSEAIELIEKAKSYIFSGNYDLTKELSQIDARTIIIFSDSKKLHKVLPQAYGQYEGYLETSSASGLIKIA